MFLRPTIALLGLGVLGLVTACSSLGNDSASLDELPPALVPGLASPPARIEGPVTATEGNQASTLLFTPPHANGSAITGYQYEVNADGMWRTLGADSIVRALSNGTSYRFRVRALNARGASAAASDPSNTIVPHGAPEAPVVTGKATGKTIDWTWTAPNGNGRPVVGYQTKLDAAPYSAMTLSTSFRATFADDATHTLCVKAFTNGDVARNESAERCSSVP
jgi:hypothetical protein